MLMISNIFELDGRLAQKLEFLAKDLVALMPTGDEELQAYR
jgi:hypothetical protein